MSDVIEVDVTAKEYNRLSECSLDGKTVEVDGLDGIYEVVSTRTVRDKKTNRFLARQVGLLRVGWI